MAEIDDLVEQFGGQPQAPATTAIVSSLDKNPETAARAYALSAETGAPPQTIYEDIKGFEQDVKEQKAREALQKSAPLTQFLNNNPAAAPLVIDDLPALSHFADQVQTDAFVPPTSLTEGIQQGWTHHEYSTNAAAYQLGDTSQLPALERYEAEQKLKVPYTGLGHFLNAFGRLLGTASASAVAALPVAAGGAAVGAAGAGAGAVPGAVAGFGYGFLADMAYTGAGEIYRQTDLARDRNGQPLSEATKQVAAMAGGLAMAALGSITPGAIGAPLKGLVQEAIGRAVTEPVVSSALARAGIDIAKAGLTGAALNTAFTLANAVPQEVAKAVSNQPFETVLNSPAEREKLVQDITQAAIDGAAMFGLLAVSGLALHPALDTMRLEQARLGGEQADRIIAAAAETKLQQRAPDLLEALVRENNKGDVYIPAEAIERVETTNPGAFSYVFDLPQQLEASRDTGADVVIPAASYFTKTEAEIHALVRDDIRMNETGLNRQEAGELKPTEISVAGEAQPERVPAIPHDRAEVPTTPAEVARQSLFLHGIFPDAQAAGMTTAEFTRYSKLIQDTQEAINSALYERTAAVERRQQTAVWKARANVVRGGVEEDFAARRDLQADRIIREKPEPYKGLRLNPREVDELMNDPSYSDTFLGKRVLGTKNTIHPDELAELLGYPSGISMLHEVRQLVEDRARRGETPARQRARMLEEETQRRMENYFGRLEDNVHNAALDAVLNTTQLDLMHEEVKALSAMAGLPPVPSRANLQAANAARFAKMPLRQALKVAGFERLVSQRGRDAEKALLAGKPVDAFRHKQRQLMATMMLQEARAFEREAKTVDRLMDRYQKHKTLGGRDQEYTDQVHKLLGDLGFALARNPRELDNALKGKTLDDFYREKTGQGRIIVDPSFVARKPLERYSVEEFRDLADVLKSLDENSKNELIITNLDKRLTLESTVEQIKVELEPRGVRFDPYDKSFFARVKQGGREFDAINIKIERLFDWIDQKDPLGILNTAVLRPLFSAKHQKDDMMREAGKILRDLKSNITPRRMPERVDNMLLTDNDGRLIPMTRENVIAIALNMGNKSNLQKMLDGYGWGRDAVEGLVHRTLTRDEWQYVQGMWDFFQHYWPMRDDIVRRTSGVGMDPIEANPIKTPYGWQRGGYYPMIYDPLASDIQLVSQGSLFESNPYFAPLPARGSTKARNEAVAKPIDLTLSLLSNRINEMLHDIAYREPLINASKVLFDREVQKAVRDGWGPEYVKQFFPWLKNIADGARTDDRGLHWLNNLSREARMNMQTMLIGFNPITAFIHGGAALVNSIYESMRIAGVKDTGAAVGYFLSNPSRWKAMWDFARENSGELRNRMHNLDRDIGMFIDDHLGDTSLRAKYQLYSMKLISAIDQASAVPAWGVSYFHYMREGMTHEDAAFAADKIVRNAHGSNGLVDSARLLGQDRPELLKWFTMFMGYFNHNYNQLRDVGRMLPQGVQAIKAGNISTGSAAFGSMLAGSMAYLIAPALWHEFWRPAPRKPGEEESFGKHLAKALSEQLAGTTPFLRDLAFAFKSGRTVTATPMGQFLEHVVDSVQDAIATDRSKRDWMRHTVTLPGMVFGLPTEQVGKVAQFMWDLHTHKQYADDPKAWVNGLLYGKSHPKR